MVDLAVEPTGSVAVVWGSVMWPVQSSRWVALPTAPLITAATSLPYAVALDFAAPATTEPAFAPVNYAYSLDNGATWIARDPPSTVSPVMIEGLASGTAYRVALRAINVAGGGVASLPVTFTAGPAPGPPTGLEVASVFGSRVTLQWLAPGRSTTPTGYLLEGGISPGEVLASYATGSAAPTFTFDAPTGVFHIRVHALAGAYRSVASNEVRLVVNVPEPPSAPTNLLGLVNGSDIALSWTNTFTGGAPTSLWLDVTGALTTTLPLPRGEAFTYANVPPGTYTLSVIAANASGVSPPSNAVTLTFPGAGCSGVPGAPTNLQTWKVGNTIFLSWSPPAEWAGGDELHRLGDRRLGRGFHDDGSHAFGRGGAGQLCDQRQRRQRVWRRSSHAGADRRDSVTSRRARSPSPCRSWASGCSASQRWSARSRRRPRPPPPRATSSSVDTCRRDGDSAQHLLGTVGCARPDHG